MREASLTLLVTSSSTTKPFSRSALRCLQVNLSHYHANADPEFRGVFVTAMQKLFNRLRAATSRLYKAKLRQASENGAFSNLLISSAETTATSREATLEDHISFLESYVNFMRNQTCPGLSYQRRISSLFVLDVLTRSGIDKRTQHGRMNNLSETPWSFEIPLLNDLLKRNLYNLSVDAYDDVRHWAITLQNNLKCNDCDTGVYSRTKANSQLTLPSFNQQSKKFEELRHIIGPAEKLMLLTGRADHADGVARLYQMLVENSPCPDPNIMKDTRLMVSNSHMSRYGILSSLLAKCEASIEVAKDNLAFAVLQYPLHGIFACIRSVGKRSICDNRPTSIDIFSAYRRYTLVC